MRRIRVEHDVQPVSAFRASAAKLIGQIQAHKRPLVLTQRGRSAAVVLDPAEYDRLIETIELLEDVHKANAQITAGKVLTESKARKALIPRSNK
jgi:prevent-host-death family protein